MKVVSVVGARPQFIKAATVSRMLRESSSSEVLLHTGQHYDYGLSEVFFDELDIPVPAHDLGVGSGPHGQQTGRMLEAVERVLMDEQPDGVLVYGDTNSTLAGALAAVKLHLPVAHVEAGLRSFNRKMPEEINRVLTDHASNLLFAPTDTAVENLLEEGIGEDRIRQVGDVMYDAALFFAERADRTSSILEDLGLEEESYLLATVHRAENTDDPDRLRAVFRGLTAIADEVPVVLPLHPRTRSALADVGELRRARESLRLIDPVSYLDMVMLEKNAALIVTDSGGVQKEAYFQGVPCLTVRDETEWVELVELGWNRLAPPRSAAQVEAAIRESLSAEGGRSGAEPYGSGDSARRIVEELLRSWRPNPSGRRGPR